MFKMLTEFYYIQNEEADTAIISDGQVCFVYRYDCIQSFDYDSAYSKLHNFIESIYDGSCSPYDDKAFEFYNKSFEELIDLEDCKLLCHLSVKIVENDI